jgi:transposase-like protein
MLTNRKVTQKKLSVNVREMYVNGSGFRAIERVKKVHHTTVINWVKEIGNTLADTPECDEIPEITLF